MTAYEPRPDDITLPPTQSWLLDIAALAPDLDQSPGRSHDGKRQPSH